MDQTASKNQDQLPGRSDMLAKAAQLKTARLAWDTITSPALGVALTKRDHSRRCPEPRPSGLTAAPPVRGGQRSCVPCRGRALVPAHTGSAPHPRTRTPGPPAIPAHRSPGARTPSCGRARGVDLRDSGTQHHQYSQSHRPPFPPSPAHSSLVGETQLSPRAVR